MRYYYKCGKNYLDLSSPISNPNYIEITKEEFREGTRPEAVMGAKSEDMAKQKRIAELMGKLRALDYIGVKIATGRATREEYAEEIALMQQYADEINELKGEN